MMEGRGEKANEEISVNRPTRPALCLGVLVLAFIATAEPSRAAADLAKEMASAQGTRWYGVYFVNRQKCGWARMVIDQAEVDGRPTYRFQMDLSANVRMGAAEQKISIEQTRYYWLSGELARVDTETTSLLGSVVVRAEAKGDEVIVTSEAGGHNSRQAVAGTKESLVSLLASKRLIEQAEPGAEITFEVFEPSMLKSITVTAKLLRFEDRMLGGVKTRIGVVESQMKELGMTSTDYVNADGELIETVVGKLFTLRLEPEKTAKDVQAAFDALRAGIIPVKRKLGDPRRVTGLTLRLSGVTRRDVLIDDERQTYTRGEGGAEAKHKLVLKAAVPPKKPPTLPLDLAGAPEGVADSLKASGLIQSDAPAIAKAAKQIVGDTRDAYAAACRIQGWVYGNVEKKGLAALSNALEVLKKKEGDCSEHAVLFVALCRAAGIPARHVVGIGYSSSMGGFGYHAWGEVYVGRWVAMDPTWGENLADATHVKFGVGDSESVGAIAGLFGSLKIEVLDATKK
jgi:hypothetical protein